MCDKIYTIDEIRAIASPIAKSHGVAALYLFGSYARGDATSESDLDFRIEKGQIRFEYPAALAEIVLIVLTVKLDNTILPSTQEEIETTVRALVALLEKGTENPIGSLNFLTVFDKNK